MSANTILPFLISLMLCAVIVSPLKNLILNITKENDQEREKERNLVRLGSQEWLKRARVGKTAAPIRRDFAPSSNLLPSISSWATSCVLNCSSSRKWKRSLAMRSFSPVSSDEVDDALEPKYPWLSRHRRRKMAKVDLWKFSVLDICS